MAWKDYLKLSEIARLIKVGVWHQKHPLPLPPHPPPPPPLQANRINNWPKELNRAQNVPGHSMNDSIPARVSLCSNFEAPFWDVKPLVCQLPVTDMRY